MLASDDSYTLAEGAPVLGRSALIRAESGDVFFRAPDETSYRKLTRKTVAVPMRSFVDARRGRVRITVMRGRNSERTASAVFYDGKFQLTQEADSPYVTDLRLAGRHAVCAGAASRPRDGGVRKRSKRRLWGRGKGRFRTSGRYSAATVRGTWWLVEDRCQGTLTRVRRGVVDVEEYVDSEPAENPPVPDSGGGTGSEPQPAAGEGSPARKRVRLKRGGSYLARSRK